MAAEQQPIHQIIATHCTYGNNAISPRTGELEDRAMGYSVRKASIPKKDLRMWYQTIEKFFNYSLPADTPVEAKGTLDAKTAPKKFLFVPSTRGFQFVGSVFYRQEDTAGRPGSYFGHVLINKLERKDEPWSATDAMQLFDWDWTQEDSESLPELSGLNTLPAASPKSVDDKLIYLFVTSDRAADFEKAPNGHLVPPRWREMTAQLRQKKLRCVLRAAMESCMDKKRSALLVCEPELAILFFYAIGRLVPASILADASFSTFETEYQKRLAVQIAATTLAPEVDCNTAIDDAVLRRQFVVNTFGGTDSPETASNKSKFGHYVQGIVSRLQHDGWSETEKILEAFAAAAPEDASQLNSVLIAERAVQSLLGTSSDEFPPEVLKPKSQNYIGSRLREFCVEGSCSTVLARLKQNPALLQKFLELTCAHKYYESCREVVDSLIRELPQKVAENLVEKQIRDNLSSEFVAKIIAWRFLEKQESFSKMSEMCDEAIKNASSPRRDNICSLVEAIGFLNSPTNVINEKYLQKNVPPPKWHGVLLTLIDPKLAKLDLFGLQRKVFSWFDTNQQIKFIACVFDLNAASADFRKFLLLEVSKQLDRTPPDPKQLQTCTSMFYKHEHFREQVLALKNIARNLDDGGSYDLQLAEQLVACFDKAIRPKPDNLGALQPVYNLYDKLKEIYLSEGKSPDKAAVHAINILKAFSGGDGRSLYKLLELKWDMQLETRFAGGTTQSQHSTQRPPREKTPTGRQASPKRSEAEPKPHPTHPQGYMGPNQSGTGKQSARVYIVVSLLAVGAIGLFAIGFTAGRSQSVAVVDHVGDGIDQNETSSSNALEDGEGPPPEPVVETPDNSGGGTVNTGQTDSEKAAAEAKKKAAAEKAAAEKADAEKADADKTAADKTAADKMAADKKAADKTAADKTAADKKAADKRAADLANKRVVHQPLGQGNGKRDDNFTPPLDKLYFHEIKLAELTAVTPKIIAIPAGDLRAPKPGWPQPGQFNIRKSEKTENLWEVVRDEDKLTYAYFEWVPGKRLLRVYRAQPGNNVPEKQFGAKATIPAEPNKQQVERLDRRGNRFLSYCHLIQLDEKTFFSMGLNQALAPRAGKKTAENLMRRKFNTDPFLAPSTPLLNHMADLRLVSKPSTWSIELDKVYVTGGQTSSKAYKAVPANAFAGTPNSNEGTSGGKYSGLKCKYTDFAMRVRFVAQTSQIQVWPEGTFKSLEELMEKQVAVRVQEYRLDELMKKPTGDDKKLNDFRIVEINRAKKNLAEAKGAVAEFMKNNSKLKDLRDDPEATAALVTYYRSVNKTKGLSVSLTISRRQNINGQEVVIPFWYPVIP